MKLAVLCLGILLALPGYLPALPTPPAPASPY